MAVDYLKLDGLKDDIARAYAGTAKLASAAASLS